MWLEIKELGQAQALSFLFPKEPENGYHLFEPQPCTYIYIYIYIDRERERERESARGKMASVAQKFCCEWIWGTWETRSIPQAPGRFFSFLCFPGAFLASKFCDFFLPWPPKSRWFLF